jgi:hypothetical protein
MFGLWSLRLWEFFDGVMKRLGRLFRWLPNDLPPT